ncbi:iron-containing redox enzyme family protein [Pectobacterium polonicum]|uniref:Iron-containing redox enzyme family protein n=1 Tax=Pectobacterium polonicum TaxID=2485124 RepID=A0AAE9NV96_9GAMM|nr:iron-containing redox enzyme family protein [Pectobacterium polonicum]UVO10037.1 iron-containing redox enzyme family protein [Pectobacterium polonicum]
MDNTNTLSFLDAYNYFLQTDNLGFRKSLSRIFINKVKKTDRHIILCTEKPSELEHVLKIFFDTKDNIVNTEVGMDDEFNVDNIINKLTLSYILNDTFDARYSHLQKSCNYYLLFDTLRKVKVETENRIDLAGNLLGKYSSDRTKSDVLFSTPALRMAISNLCSGTEQDCYIISELLLSLFENSNDLTGYLVNFRFDDSVESVYEEKEHEITKAKRITCLMLRKICEKKDEAELLSKTLFQLSEFKIRKYSYLKEISLMNRDNSITAERIFSSKSKMAYGYHQKSTVLKCPFDNLMKNDIVAFTKALKETKWFHGDTPNEMPFFKYLIGFNGPMFKVFSNQEIKEIKQWATSKSLSREEIKEEEKKFELKISAPHKNSSEYRKEKNIRKIFFDLMNSEDHSFLDWHSEIFVDDWLIKSRKEIKSIPFATYNEIDLDLWFLGKTKLQIEDYQQGRIDLNKTREEVIDEAIHLSPMILLDGAWINQFSHPTLIDDDIGEILYEIYSDEIGNGYNKKNHPVIYRNLICSMGVTLPDITSREFSESKLFDDEDFYVPVYWLSISRSPQKYLPETLGLNLAMELSGVGGAYNQARDELKKYGFDSLFVDLHNSIDNAASGHSAGALNAIKIFMRRHTNKKNPVLTKMLWERIWTGYLSLIPPKTSIFFPVIKQKYKM